MVLGIEDQSQQTTHDPGYGDNSAVPLETAKGWLNGKEGFGELSCKAEIRSDHTIIAGEVKWVNAATDRAVILPEGIAPVEEYSFATRREDKSFVIVRVVPGGFVLVPKGNKSRVRFHFRYPTLRDGG